MKNSADLKKTNHQTNQLFKKPKPKLSSAIK